MATPGQRRAVVGRGPFHEGSLPAAVLLAAVLFAGALLGGCGRREGPPRAEGPGTWKHLELAILEDYDKNEDLSGVERDFALVHELSIHTWRGSFGWDDYEPAPGRFDFGWLHRFADLAERHGITLRPYIGYTPEWAAAGRRADGAIWNDPPKRLDDWRRFVEALAGAMRRHRNVVSYEIYNEENARQWWDGTEAEYDSLLDTASRAIRGAHPGAAVVLGGMTWPDPDWLESACASDPRAFDAVPFHAYPETWTPDSVRVENTIGPTYRDLLAAVDSCGGKPVWINETGFATVPGKSEADQARWWVRALATFAAAPRLSLIGVYEIKDLKAGRPAIGGAPNYHLGLTRADRTKKEAFRTVAFLGRFFDAESVRVEDPQIDLRAVSGGVRRDASGRAGAAAVFRHLFRRPDGARLLIVWDEGAPAAVDVSVPGGFDGAREVGLDGRAAPLRGVVGGGLRGLRLDPGVPRMILIGDWPLVAGARR